MSAAQAATGFSTGRNSASSCLCGADTASHTWSRISASSCPRRAIASYSSRTPSTTKSTSQSAITRTSSRTYSAASSSSCAAYSPAWANSQAAAEQEKISIKSLKIQQHEMDERRKRTCILIIYHTVRDLFFHLLRHLLTNVGISRAVNLLYELINISQHSHIFVSQHAPSLSMTLNYQPPAVLISGKVNG